MMYDKMLLEKQRLEKEIRYMERKLKTLPEGRLVCAGTKDYPQYYQCIGSKKIYITKQNYAVAEQLALKKYLTLRIRDFRRKLKGVCAYLKANNPDLDTASKLLHSTSKCGRLLESYYRPENAELAQWTRDTYLQNKKYPDQLKHDTVIGLKVRSKSEAMIVRELVECKIPFHYEEELEIEGVRLYPDFTLRHPQTGERIYWEHFGRLDDARYQKNLCQKLQLYMQSGIFPSDQLIVTWETRDTPLTLSEIHYKIQKYLF